MDNFQQACRRGDDNRGYAVFVGGLADIQACFQRDVKQRWAEPLERLRVRPPRCGEGCWQDRKVVSSRTPMRHE